MILAYNDLYVYHIGFANKHLSQQGKCITFHQVLHKPPCHYLTKGTDKKGQSTFFRTPPIIYPIVLQVKLHGWVPLKVVSVIQLYHYQNLVSCKIDLANECGSGLNVKWVTQIFIRRFLSVNILISNHCHLYRSVLPVKNVC